MTRTYNVIDADGHVLEPPGLWSGSQYLEEKLALDPQGRIYRPGTGFAGFAQRMAITVKTAEVWQCGYGADSIGAA